MRPPPRSSATSATRAQLKLALPEAFSLAVTARSHGWYDLPPFAWDGTRLDRVILVGDRAHDLRVTQSGRTLTVTASPAAPAPAVRAQLTAILRLDEALDPFYALTDGDPRLGYARGRGAGRLLRAPTVFEDVVKMLLTTNCSWAFTRQMVGRLVETLGTPAPSGRRAFPTPARMAEEPERFYRDVIRAGYRAPHLHRIAADVAAGKLDLELFRTLGDPPDPETARDALLALPGIGPYAADNLLRLLGAYGYLGLDSWCRATLKRLYPRARDVDAAASRRYRRFGRFQGLAMWLDLTRDWHISA